MAGAAAVNPFLEITLSDLTERGYLPTSYPEGLFYVNDNFLTFYDYISHILNSVHREIIRSGHSIDIILAPLKADFERLPQSWQSLIHIYFEGIKLIYDDLNAGGGGGITYAHTHGKSHYNGHIVMGAYFFSLPEWAISVIPEYIVPIETAVGSRRYNLYKFNEWYAVLERAVSAAAGGENGKEFSDYDEISNEIITKLNNIVVDEGYPIGWIIRWVLVIELTRVNAGISTITVNEPGGGNHGLTENEIEHVLVSYNTHAHSLMQSWTNSTVSAFNLIEFALRGDYGTIPAALVEHFDINKSAHIPEPMVTYSTPTPSYVPSTIATTTTTTTSTTGISGPGGLTIPKSWGATDVLMFATMQDHFKKILGVPATGIGYIQPYEYYIAETVFSARKVKKALEGCIDKYIPLSLDIITMMLVQCMCISTKTNGITDARLSLIGMTLKYETLKAVRSFLLPHRIEDFDPLNVDISDFANDIHAVTMTTKVTNVSDIINVIELIVNKLISIQENWRDALLGVLSKEIYTYSYEKKSENILPGKQNDLAKIAGLIPDSIGGILDVGSLRDLYGGPTGLISRISNNSYLVTYDQIDEFGNILSHFLVPSIITCINKKFSTESNITCMYPIASSKDVIKVFLGSHSINMSNTQACLMLLLCYPAGLMMKISREYGDKSNDTLHAENAKFRISLMNEYRANEKKMFKLLGSIKNTERKELAERVLKETKHPIVITKIFVNTIEHTTSPMDYIRQYTEMCALTVYNNSVTVSDITTVMKSIADGSLVPGGSDILKPASDLELLAQALRSMSDLLPYVFRYALVCTASYAQILLSLTNAQIDEYKPIFSTDPEISSTTDNFMILKEYSLEITWDDIGKLKEIVKEISYSIFSTILFITREPDERDLADYLSRDINAALEDVLKDISKGITKYIDISKMSDLNTGTANIKDYRDILDALASFFSQEHSSKRSLLHENVIPGSATEPPVTGVLSDVKFSKLIDSKLLKPLETLYENYVSAVIAEGNFHWLIQVDNDTQSPWFGRAPIVDFWTCVLREPQKPNYTPYDKDNSLDIFKMNMQKIVTEIDTRVGAGANNNTLLSLERMFPGMWQCNILFHVENDLNPAVYNLSLIAYTFTGLGKLDPTMFGNLDPSNILSGKRLKHLKAHTEELFKITDLTDALTGVKIDMTDIKSDERYTCTDYFNPAFTEFYILAMRTYSTAHVAYERKHIKLVEDFKTPFWKSVSATDVFVNDFIVGEFLVAAEFLLRDTTSQQFSILKKKGLDRDALMKKVSGYKIADIEKDSDKTNRPNGIPLIALLDTMKTVTDADFTGLAIGNLDSPLVFNRVYVMCVYLAIVTTISEKAFTIVAPKGSSDIVTGRIELVAGEKMYKTIQEALVGATKLAMDNIKDDFNKEYLAACDIGSVGAITDIKKGFPVNVRDQPDLLTIFKDSAKTPYDISTGNKDNSFANQIRYKHYKLSAPKSIDMAGYINFVIAGILEWHKDVIDGNAVVPEMGVTLDVKDPSYAAHYKEKKNEFIRKEFERVANLLKSEAERIISKELGKNVDFDIYNAMITELISPITDSKFKNIEVASKKLEGTNMASNFAQLPIEIRSKYNFIGSLAALTLPATSKITPPYVDISVSSDKIPAVGNIMQTPVTPVISLKQSLPLTPSGEVKITQTDYSQVKVPEGFIQRKGNKVVKRLNYVTSQTSARKDDDDDDGVGLSGGMNNNNTGLPAPVLTNIALAPSMSNISGDSGTVNSPAQQTKPITGTISKTMTPSKAYAASAVRFTGLKPISLGKAAFS